MRRPGLRDFFLAVELDTERARRGTYERAPFCSVYSSRNPSNVVTLELRAIPA